MGSPPTPVKCKFCHSWFTRKHGATRRDHCYKESCEKKQHRARLDKINERLRGYRAEGYFSKNGKYANEKYRKNRSPKREVRRLWEEGKPLIKCSRCRQMKPGPINPCFDCRERIRSEIDTNFMYL